MYTGISGFLKPETRKRLVKVGLVLFYAGCMLMLVRVFMCFSVWEVTARNQELITCLAAIPLVCGFMLLFFFDRPSPASSPQQ